MDVLQYSSTKKPKLSGRSCKGALMDLGTGPLFPPPGERKGVGVVVIVVEVGEEGTSCDGPNKCLYVGFVVTMNRVPGRAFMVGLLERGEPPNRLGDN